MDFLDVPLVHLLEPMFFERHPDGLEDQVVDVQQSPAAFRWEDTCSALERAEHQVSPEADRMVELGSPALDSIALSMQKLFQGSSSSMLQTTANSIFAVVRGEGETVIDGKSHCWSFGDTIAVPGWRSYQHHAKSDAVLLRVTDSALMEKFGWLRTRVL